MNLEQLESLVFAGFGGQGIMFAGQLLAYAAMDAGYNVTWIPSYGPEMRGGTANCFVVISKRLIGSPVVKQPKIGLMFNAPSFQKFEPILEPDGLLISNGSLIAQQSQRDDLEKLVIPATDTASELGNLQLTNMVMLGALLTVRPILPLEVLRETLTHHIPEHRKHLLPANYQALERGAQFAKDGRALFENLF